jgi:cytochrome c553
MPAWPSPLRDDEVWAMVAFLRKYPGMSEQEYERMARGEAGKSGEVAPLSDLEVPEGARRAVAGNCARCHGLDGLGRGNGAHPRLAGQSRDYLELSLAAYARRERYSGLMEPIAGGLNREEMSEIARYYASLPGARPQASTEDGAAIERGAAIAQRGIIEQRVPACVSCHGPGRSPRNSVYPVLSGQYADYLVLQLKLFKGEQRGGTPYAHIMHRVAIGLNEEQMRDVARYFASLDSAAAGLEAATGSDKQR